MYRIQSELAHSGWLHEEPEDLIAVGAKEIEAPDQEDQKECHSEAEGLEVPRDSLACLVGPKWLKKLESDVCR